MRRPVVLIHGMWSTGSNFDRICTTLRDRGHDCLTPTLPAHTPDAADSDVGPLGLRDYLGYLENYIAEREFSDAPILIGHSMGGLLAQQLAARIKPFALVLLTPAAPAGILALSLSNIIAFSRTLLRWGWWRRANKPSYRRAVVSAFNGVAPERQRELYEGLVQESGRVVFEMGFWFLDKSRASAVDFSQIQCPVYVVSAGADRLTPASVVRRVAARYPGSSLRHYPSRGHWVLDDPDTDEMATEIANWLQGHEHRVAARGRA